MPNRERQGTLSWKIHMNVDYRSETTDLDAILSSCHNRFFDLKWRYNLATFVDDLL
jgi:hypothetical protein